MLSLKPNTKGVHPLFITVIKTVAVGRNDTVDDVESESKPAVNVMFAYKGL